MSKAIKIQYSFTVVLCNMFIACLFMFDNVLVAAVIILQVCKIPRMWQPTEKVMLINIGIR